MSWPYSARVIDPATAPHPKPSVKPPIIGIAGGIGSGKTAVARALAALGCEVCNSDDAARTVLALPEVSAAIIKRVAREGRGVALSDGSVDRSALAHAIFTDPVLRRDIESIMHPRIEALRRAQFAAASTTARALVIDAPLLFEAGLDRECDAVLFVETPRALRLDRLHVARGWSDAELARREDSQLPLDEKRRRSSDVVENHADAASLERAVAVVLGRILARVEARSSRATP